MAVKKKEESVVSPQEINTLKIEIVPIESIFQDPSNVRKHPAKNINAIKSSLRKFGQQTPIVVGKNDIILKGNGTYESALQLGWKEIQIVRSTLVGSQATSYAIADNRTGELAEWEYQGLASLLKDLQDEGEPLGDLGWEDHELKPLFNADWNPVVDSELDFEFDSKGHPKVGTQKGTKEKSGDAPYKQAEPAPGTAVIIVTLEQQEVIEEAISLFKKTTNNSDATIGESLKFMCNYFINNQMDSEDEESVDGE